MSVLGAVLSMCRPHPDVCGYIHPMYVPTYIFGYVGETSRVCGWDIKDMFGRIVFTKLMFMGWKP